MIQEIEQILQQLNTESDINYLLRQENEKLKEDKRLLLQVLEAAQSDYKFDGIISEQTAKDIREAIKKVNQK